MRLRLCGSRTVDSFTNVQGQGRSRSRGCCRAPACRPMQLLLPHSALLGSRVTAVGRRRSYQNTL